jgi:uncharacterized membrane protein
MNIELIGRKIFGIGMIYLAVLSALSQDFIVGRPPAVNTSAALGIALAVLLMIAAGMIVFNHRRSGQASVFIAILIFVFSFLLRYLPALFSAASLDEAVWMLNGYKTLALVGGALVVAASFFTNEKLSGFAENSGAARYFTITGTLLLSLFLIVCGISHFKYADFVRDFIPSYIPFHVFWTYFCGICLIAGGVGLLVRSVRKLAALLSGTMIAGWFLLLHIPRFAADYTNVSDRLGLGESFIFAGVFFVLTALFAKTK